MIKDKIKIITTNILYIVISVVILCLTYLLFFNISGDKNLIYFLFSYIFFIIVSIYFFGGKLEITQSNNQFNFKWLKKPLFSKKNDFKLDIKDIVYSSYVKGHWGPDQMNIVTKNDNVSFRVSIFNKKNLCEAFIKSINDQIKKKYNNDEDILKSIKKETNYFKKLNLTKKNIDFGTKLLGVLFLVSTILIIIFDNNFTGIIFSTNIILLILFFIISGILRLNIEGFLSD